MTIVERVLLHHAGETLRVDRAERPWFGRSADATVTLQCGPDDVTVSRRAGELAFDVIGWRVVNVGRRPFHVVQGGAEQEVLPQTDKAGGVLIVGADAWLRIPSSSGDLHIVVETELSERPSLHLFEGNVSPGSTIREQQISLTDNELRSVVAIYAGYLELPPRYRPEPNSYRAASHRLGVEEGKVRADLRRVQEKVVRAGGLALEGSRRRDVLIQWLMSREVVRRDHLDLLD